MYNLLIALGVGAAVAVIGGVAFGPLAGILPGLLVFVGAQFALGRRTGAAIQVEIAKVEPLLQARKIDEAVALFRGIQTTWGRWQFLLDSQVEAQLGVLDYMQMKFDDARPKLDQGGRGPFSWTAFGRNPLALGLLACIHYRQGRKDDTWKSFAAAGEASSPDPVVFQVWATLASRDGKRPEALAAVAAGLKAHPNHKALSDLQTKIANDKRVDPKEFGQAWYQFFPEDLLKEQVMTGRRGTPAGQSNRPPQPRFGARHAPRR